MKAVITLDHKEVKKAIENFVRTSYSTTIPLDNVVLTIDTIYADNKAYDTSYSAALTFSMENVKPLGNLTRKMEDK